MPSPDLSDYISLALVDRDPQDVFDTAILNLQANVPDWIPREGNIEVLLLESLALEVSEAVFAINRLPDAVVEVILSILNIERDSGTPPTAQVRFQLGISTGTTIPAGITLVLELPNGFDPVIFTTDEELVIPPGATSGVVSATADRFTSDANEVAAETTLQILDTLTYVDYAKTNSIISGGRDPEEDIEFLTRGVQRLQRLTTTLVVPKNFESAALEYPFVKKAKALDNYNSTADLDGNGPVGNDAGYIAVAVYGDNEPVSATNKSILADYYTENSQANLIVTIIDPTINQVDVTASIHVDPDVLPSDVIDAVELALQDFLNIQSWPWETTVRRNDIISVITNVPGVDYLESLTVPSGDLTLTGVAPLAHADILTITAIT